MALSGISFIQQHAQGFFLNSTGRIYRLVSQANDGAGGLTETRNFAETIKCALEESKTGPKRDEIEGEQPTNQQLFDLITISTVELLPTDEVVINGSRYAITGHTRRLTNQATARTAVKPLPASDSDRC